MKKTWAQARRKQRSALSLAALACLAASVHSAELVNDERMILRWDNSLKYTLGARTAAPASFYTSDPNTNDGDAAFGKRGKLVSNRVDLLSEFDLTLKDPTKSGLRVSAAGWYDAVYNRAHDAIDAGTYNPTSVSNTAFTDYARKWAGRNIELYDAFVHTGFDLGGHDLSVRLGRHTLMWGESLLLAGNGISAAQAPVDIGKVLTVPGIQTKDFLMPVNQLSASLSLNANWDLAAYYQLEYRANRLPAPGTFFSPADLVYDGAERLILAPGFAVPLQGTPKPPKDRGQWGLAMKYRSAETGADYGFYYLRYTAKTPQVMLGLAGIPVAPFAVPSNYFFAYPQNIELYGLSTSTHVGDANVAGEVSLRKNIPLTSLATALVALPGQAPDSARPWATGDALQWQVSTLWTLPRVAAWDSATLVAEVGGITLLKTTANEAARDTSTSKSSLALGVNLEPTWYQVLPDVDLSTPIGLTYNFNDKKPAVDSFGAARGGSTTIGVKFVYANTIRGGLYYTKQLGEDSKNAFGDRDFVALNLNYSF